MIYSGKLYKCIIAVAVPEEFNINKWDDVTASEAFAAMPSAILTVTADGVKTNGDIITEMLSLIGRHDIDHMDVVTSDGGIYRFICDTITDSYVRFNQTHVGGTLNTIICDTFLVRSSPYRGFVVVNSDGTVSVTVLTSEIATNGNRYIVYSK